MRILVLGGTRFIGRHIVQAALRDDQEVTVFNRGRDKSDIFPEVEKLKGDRHQDLSVLKGRQWDVVIDTSGYVPGSVRAAARQLSEEVQNYIYISSVSVYNDFDQTPMDEQSSVYEITQAALDKAQTTSLDGSPTAVDYGESYGALKAECERVVKEEMPGRALIVRLGLVVGAHDYSNRFPYWIERISKGGNVLAPDDPTCPISLVDCRDAGEWIIRMAKHRKTGVFNVAGQKAMTFGSYLDACRSVTQSDAHVTWVKEQFLIEQDVKPWNDLPLWLTLELQNRFSFTSEKAEQEGLIYRTLEETVAHTWAWMTEESPDYAIDLAMNEEKEKQLLKLWRQAHQSAGGSSR